MARKDLLKDLMSGTPPEARHAPAPRMTKGAIGAVSQSIADLKTRALIEVPTDLIDQAGLVDRLDSDDAGTLALAESIKLYGQQVPVLLRHSPNDEGRFEVVYGRRRVAALRSLGLPVKAMLRDLSDRDLIVAQGQENAARKDLTFIEKANFARQMVAHGFERKVICDALHIDKTVISRMLQVAEAVPEVLIRAIGAAPAAGRDRWLALTERAKGHPVKAMVASAIGETSDDRFLAVFNALATARAVQPPAPLIDRNGANLGKARQTKGRTVLELTGKASAFGDWLLENIADLHADWQAQEQTKK
jgi:ParB family transcriptional regulator, chromosome partitioning protein